MGELIPLKTRPSDAEREDLWRDYTSKAERAQRSRNIDDGLAAGRAWRRWLESFV